MARKNKMKEKNNYRIRGTVTGERDGQEVSNLRVEAWDKDLIIDDLLGSAKTDKTGSFTIKFDKSYYQEICFDRKPDIYFKVFRGKRLLTNTEPSVMWNVKKAEKSVTLFVNVGNDDDNDTPSTNRTVYKANSFIPYENINTIYEAIARVWPDGKQQQKQSAAIASLECVAGTLGLLWNDARDSLQGDRLAENRLLAQLNTLVLDTSFAQTGPADLDSQVQPISGEAGFIPNPRLPGFRYHCLFPPLRVTDIYFAIARLVELVPNAPTDVVDTYFGRVLSLVERLAPLETVHWAARRVLDGEPDAEDYFAASLECVGDVPGVSNRQPIAMSFGNFPEPGLQRPPLIFDYCRAIRWQETANVVECFRRHRAAPRYNIDDIVNLTKGVSRRGCVDDEMEIQGSNLGRRGRITLGRGVEATTLSWTDSSIRFIVSADARSSDIGICIDPEIEACVGFPRFCRLPAEGTDHSFEFVHAPEIDSFTLAGPTVRSTDSDLYEAEACSGIKLNVIARHAEQVVIRDGMDIVIWDSGEAEPHTIDTEELDTPLVLHDLQENVTFTLEVSNLCGTVSRMVELSIYKAIHLTSGSRVRAGDSIDLTLRISCHSSDSGTPVTLVSNIPDAFTLPDNPVVISAGETTTTVTLHASSTCVETEISATAPDHRGDSLVILVFDTPIITEVTPLERNACSSFSLDIRGDCFDPEAAGNSVLATNGTETVSLSVMNIRFLNSTNRGRNAILEVHVENLLPGSWELFAVSHGLTGVRFAPPLVIRPVPAEIYSFSSNPLRITPCVDNSVELRWEVSHVERLEISSSGRSVVTRSYGPACTPRSDRERVTISEAASYQLLAFPIGGGAPVSSPPLRVEEVATLQAEEVRVENWTRSELFPEHTLTIWQWNGTTGERINHGIIRHGEGVTIRLTHCHRHRIYGVSHEWISKHNRSFSTDFDASDPSIVDYYQFHKLPIPNDSSSRIGLLWLLGRNGRDPLIYRAEPGG